MTIMQTHLWLYAFNFSCFMEQWYVNIWAVLFKHWTHLETVWIQKLINPTDLPKWNMVFLQIAFSYIAMSLWNLNNCASLLYSISLYVVSPQDIKKTAFCLSNSNDLGQLAFFPPRPPPPPTPHPSLLVILQWSLRQVCLRQQHCRTFVLPQH